MTDFPQTTAQAPDSAPPIHPLKVWRKANRVAQAEFARRLTAKGYPTSQVTISHYESYGPDGTTPDVNRALAIAELTSGLVNAASWQKPVIPPPPADPDEGRVIPLESLP